jgi:hypothetical protein
MLHQKDNKGGRFAGWQAAAELGLLPLAHPPASSAMTRRGA